MESKSKKKAKSDRRKKLDLFLKEIGIDANQSIANNEELNFKIINEALTHTSAQSDCNHERLEFLGDAVLRLASSEFIDQEFPNMAVGERSALRSQLVSDSWLTQVGKSIHIEKILITGKKAEKDSSALATLQAEATEALIGAIYKCNKNLEQVHTWL